MSAASALPHAGLSPQEITAASKSNFSLSFLFLPAKQRRGITHFYALSRVIDDAVDEAPTPEEARRRIAFWRQEVALAYEGTPSHPVSLAMQETIREFQIPRRYLDWLLEGCEMDLEKQRYASFAELYQYCFRVAGVIGLISMKIFGLDGETERQAAEELGIALQLTNIIRDIAVDAEKGRVYLPQEDLRKFQVSEAELTAGAGGFPSPLGEGARRAGEGPGHATKQLLTFEADRAQHYFDSAFAKMKLLPRRPLVAAWIMGKVYQAILRSIRKKNFDVFSEKISVSRWKKAKIAMAESIRSFF